MDSIVRYGFYRNISALQAREGLRAIDIISLATSTADGSREGRIALIRAAYEDDPKTFAMLLEAATRKG